KPMAQDLFQETWLHVLERGRQYSAKWKFKVWLFSIARHLFIDEARRKKGSSLDELMDSETGTGFEPLAGGASPFEERQASEESRRVTRVLARIPAAHREVLVLRFQDEMALEEIATILKSPVSTVKTRLYRGLGTLRKLLEVERA